MICCVCEVAVISGVVDVTFTILFIVVVGIGELAVVEELVNSGVMMVSGGQVEPLA